MPAVSSLSFVPSVIGTQTVADSPVKAISVPVGEKSGDQSSPGLPVKRFWPEPSGFIR
jgi:hypothetical protein